MAMNQRIISHKDLDVWKKSMNLVEEICRITKNYPKEELYGITSQMRRATIAIPLNITEGFHRHHIKEYIQFLYIAKGSAAELETLLEIAERLKLNSFSNNGISVSLVEILKMLSGLIAKLKTQSINTN
jgi:four helix bundle protein